MSSLFPIQPVFPEGFQYYEDFLSEEEEMRLVTHITRLDLHTFIFQGYEAKRKVQSFGYHYHFDTRKISKGADIPSEFDGLISKVAEFLSIQREDIGHALVTEYPPGAVINWHRDAPPFDVIVGISLLSDCRFRLRPYDKAAREGKRSVIPLTVKRRSLYIIRNEARTDWEHSIAAVQDTRYSVTLRTLR